MRIFVTGATGFIGSAVVQELMNAGHKVLGLARSDASAAALAQVGADIHRGSLEDLDRLQSGATACDGVIHTGFIHDFSRFKEVCEIDERAIEALGTALAGSDRPLIITSSTAYLKTGHFATEQDVRHPPKSATYPRASEQAAALLAARGVHVSVVRLSLSVHGDGDHAFVPALISMAREKGVSAYIGDGLNRWTAVHRLDAANLFRLILEKGSAGANYHGVAEESIVFKDIAEIIGKHLNIPVISKSPEEATDHFSWLASFAGLDCPASSKLTQEQLGWRPVQASLMTDLEQGNYFKS